MAALIAASTSVAAESLLTIDRIFHDREFELDEKVPSKWLEGGDSYTTVEPSESVDGGFDIVRHDSATGDTSILVKAEQLIPEGADKPLEIDMPVYVTHMSFGALSREIKIALAKGKRQWEKKQKFKDRDIKRETDREMKYFKS